MPRASIAIFSAVFAAAIPVWTVAQAGPDFSGTWTFNVGLTPPEDRYQAPMTTLVIKQTPTEISIEASAWQQHQPPVALKLDGTETTTVNAAGTAKGKAVWDGQKIVVTSSRTFAGPQGPVSLETKEAYGLVDGVLVVEKTQTTMGGTRTNFKYRYSQGVMSPEELLAAALKAGPTGSDGNPPARQAPPRHRAAANCPVEAKAFGKCVLEKARTAKLPRTPDGKPDLQGYWQIDGTLTGTMPNQGIEAQPPSPFWGGGATMIIDPPNGVPPFQPWAAKERERLRQPENALMDPQGHCLNAGHPRQYLFLPFQILRTDTHFVVLYEVSHSYRLIPMDGRPHLKANIPLWQGDSVGRWEGDTLVVDTTHNNGKSMVDMSFVFLSDAQHTTERFTMADPDLIYFEATVDDPKVYTRPWTLNGGFIRQTQPGYQLLEAACHEDNQDLKHVNRPAGGGH